MRRIGLFSLLIALVVLLAAPTGAAFALEEEAAPAVPEAVEDEEGVNASPEPEVAVTPVPVEPAKQQMNAGGQLIDNSTSQEAPVVVAPVEPLPVSPLLVTAYKASGTHVHAVQLYNNSSSMVPLDGVSVLYVAGGDEYEIPLGSGWAEPRSYIVLAWQGESEYADLEFAFSQAGMGALERIELYHDGYQTLVVETPAGYGGELLHRYKSAAGNYTTKTTFAPGAETISGGGLYTLPGAPGMSVRELLVNPRPCLVGVETPDCYDYIKIRNDGAEPLDLGKYRLRSGFSNTNSTASNTAYFDDVLLPGEVRTLTHNKKGERVNFAANDGTVWLEDVYGYESYDLMVPPYIDSDLAAQKGRSWAFNDKTEQWQWATPAPFEIENDFTVPEAGKGSSEDRQRQLVPCKENQYRSEETNRCRNIVTASTLKPCREGQYRSEETNRCRSIATAAARVLKPCADGQFRNPETNRCKKIASTDDIALADCGEGRERNPETNRCRNVLGANTFGSTMPFPVEEVEGTERFAGWWTLGAITALGVSYGVWEWREELLRAGRRAGRFITRSK